MLSRGLPHCQLLSAGLGELGHSARLLDASGKALWSADHWGPREPEPAWDDASSAIARALEGQSAAAIAPLGEAGLAVLAEPVRAPNGRVAGVLVLCTEPRAHRAEHVLLVRLAALGMERELAACAERDAQAERQEELLRLLSHDLRTPLSTLAMHAQLLRRGRDDAAKLQKRVDAILWSGTRLNTMIQELVDLGRIESGRMKVSLRAVALGSFWAAVEEQWGGALDLRRIAFHLEPGLPSVLANPDKLGRVLATLVGNALRHSPAPAPVEVRAKADAGEVVLSVTDRGEGIAGEELPRIFQRLYRSPRADAAPEGLGLGLYLAKRLIELQGGSIGVQSERGAGSTFQVRLTTAR